MTRTRKYACYLAFKNFQRCVVFLQSFHNSTGRHLPVWRMKKQSFLLNERHSWFTCSGDNAFMNSLYLQVLSINQFHQQDRFPPGYNWSSSASLCRWADQQHPWPGEAVNPLDNYIPGNAYCLPLMHWLQWVSKAFWHQQQELYFHSG